MSELVFNGDEKLYRELGLEELLEPQSFNEDPRLRLDHSPSLRTLDGFVSFFKRQEDEGTPAAGYSELAGELVSRLERISFIASPEDGHAVIDTTIHVPLQPPNIVSPLILHEMTVDQQIDYLHNAKEGTKVYRAHETPATRAYRDVLDLVLHTSQPMAKSSIDGSLLYSARYHNPAVGERGTDVSLWLLETVGKDEIGEYYTVDLLTHRPRGYTNSLEPNDLPEEAIFIPSGELQRRAALDAEIQMAAWDEVLDEIIDEVPQEGDRHEVLAKINQPVDAPEVLKTLVHKTIERRMAA
jgi:hypothetical protein